VSDQRLFQKRDVEFLSLLGQLRGKQEKGGNPAGQHDLKKELQATADPIGTLFGDFQPVIIKTESAEQKRRDHHKPDKGIVRLRPEECGNHKGPDQEHSTHGGCPFFPTVEFIETMYLLGTPNRLSKLQ